MVRIGDVYLIPLLPGKQALATILGLGAPSWNPRLTVMLVGASDRVVEGAPPADPPGAPVLRYWCVCSFPEEGGWALVRRGTGATPERPSVADPVCATHELFLDDLRQRLGLERQTYTGAEFTFSTHCRACGAPLHPGFARCPRCGAIREEFVGLERFVADRPGCCWLSGALSDVRDVDGRYYWAPYFIDRLRSGEAGGGCDAGTEPRQPPAE
jgi:hypothetical protein